MKFLADENIPNRTINPLKERGVNILSILDFGMGLNDQDVLRLANEQDRVLVTFDKDFGDLVFTTMEKAKGVVLLRFAPKSPEQVAEKLRALLDSRVELENYFVVLDDERIRITPIRR